MVGDEGGSCEKYVLPEGLKFSSYINVASQLGNLLPLLYKVVDNSASNHREYITTFVSLTLGTVSLIIAAFCWHVSVYMGHEFGHKSLILLICTFVCGSTGCLHSVLFWRIASSFSVKCVRYQSIGSAFGGVFPMLVALLQLDDPRLTFILGAVAQLFFILIFYCIFREFKKIGDDVKDEEMGGFTNNAIEDSAETVQQEQSDTVMCCTGFSLYLCAYSIPSFIPLMTSVRGVQRVKVPNCFTHSITYSLTSGLQILQTTVHADQRGIYLWRCTRSSAHLIRASQETYGSNHDSPHGCSICSIRHVAICGMCSRFIRTHDTPG